MLGFYQDDHTYRMCNETGFPEFLEFAIPGIPMVMMVGSTRFYQHAHPTYI